MGWKLIHSLIWFFFFFFFPPHHTCESTCHTLSSSAANLGDNTVSVAPGVAVPPWVTETVLSPWFAADEDRVLHVPSLVWWKKCVLPLLGYETVVSLFWDLWAKFPTIIWPLVMWIISEAWSTSFWQQTSVGEEPPFFHLCSSRSHAGKFSEYFPFFRKS